MFQNRTSPPRPEPPRQVGEYPVRGTFERTGGAGQRNSLRSWRYKPAGTHRATSVGPGLASPGPRNGKTFQMHSFKSTSQEYPRSGLAIQATRYPRSSCREGSGFRSGQTRNSMNKSGRRWISSMTTSPRQRWQELCLARTNGPSSAGLPGQSNCIRESAGTNKRPMWSTTTLTWPQQSDHADFAAVRSGPNACRPVDRSFLDGTP